MNPIDLTFKLCKIPSITGEEAQICQEVAGLLRELGFDVQTQQVGDIEGRVNILATLGQPRVLLSTHLDTVPPFLEPKIVEGDLVGRGVCDAKGIAAAMIVAACELKKEGISQIGLLFVVGEETNSDGAKAAANGFAPKVDYIINGEPTDLKLATGMKGSIVFELETFGKAGHSAYPETGRSAVHQLIEATSGMLNHTWPNDPDFGQTTVNIGKFEGGKAPNVIADHAVANGIFRTTIDADKILNVIPDLTRNLDHNLKVLSKSSPRHLHVVEGVDTCVVSFGSDIPHLSSLGKALLIGPGSILDAHTAQEKVHISDLERAVQIYIDLTKRLLK